MQDQKKRPAGPTGPAESEKVTKIPPTMIDTSELEEKLKEAEKKQTTPKRRPCCCC